MEVLGRAPSVDGVSVTHPNTTKLHDHDLPAVQVLLADGVPLPLAMVFDQAGVTIERAIATQVTWWPGRSIVVSYSALCSGALTGDHHIVACAGHIPAGAALVDGGGIHIGAWRVPHDPALPGLAAALDPGTAGRLVHGLGMPAERVHTRLRAYRPGRRAVVEVRGEHTLVYLKLVPPVDVERLHRSHTGLPAGFPAPPSLGVDPDLGVLALPALPGLTLRRAIADPAALLPAAQDLQALLRRLPSPCDAARSRSPIEQLPALARLLARILPDEQGWIEELVKRIGKETRPATVAVHGDFHEGQLLVERGRVVGILDIDTIGQGRPGDDPATLLGHLAVLATTSPHPDRVAYLCSRLYCRGGMAAWMQSICAGEWRQ